MWQTQGLERAVLGSVAIAGLTGEFLDLWQGKDLGDRERREHSFLWVFLKRYDSMGLSGQGARRSQHGVRGEHRDSLEREKAELERQVQRRG